MPCYFLTLARAAARRAAKVASALLALSMAGRGFGIPVILLALTPAQNSTISQSINHAFIWHISPQGPGVPLEALAAFSISAAWVLCANLDSPPCTPLAPFKCLRGVLDGMGPLAAGLWPRSVETRGPPLREGGEGSACLFGHGNLGGSADEWGVHCGKARGFEGV
ncbi:MAG: hypothetical protein FRX49_01816 [Trebouxia sp. A1-2]|nr:MAG: hypothetical protein FRX49_01816 [Trebouxia sp. A1-2]